ncbi:hypothetical protein OUZ56_008355 [Daphnia magna]|uniref:Uncharacterized protein n=1 Tax=Daphnia magna TaxID=35525 RepID=A0ABR0ACQ8_9CRUS|nr:hypothetical protein OUZ56_008355 [Daphnia magna]
MDHSLLSFYSRGKGGHKSMMADLFSFPSITFSHYPFSVSEGQLNFCRSGIIHPLCRCVLQ